MPRGRCRSGLTDVVSNASSSSHGVHLPFKDPSCVSSYGLDDPPSRLCHKTIVTIRPEVFRNDGYPRVASGPSLVNFGAPSEFDPNRLRQSLRITAAFLSFRAPTAFSEADGFVGDASPAFRLRRSSSLTVLHRFPEPRSLKAPAPGVHPAKLFPLNWFLAANAGGTRAAPHPALRR